MWLKRSDGNVVNVNTGTSVVAIQDGANWKLRTTGNVELNGSYASESAAQDAARKLTKAGDPTTLV